MRNPMTRRRPSNRVSYRGPLVLYEQVHIIYRFLDYRNTINGKNFLGLYGQAHCIYRGGLYGKFDFICKPGLWNNTWINHYHYNNVWLTVCHRPGCIATLVKQINLPPRNIPDTCNMYVQWSILSHISRSKTQCLDKVIHSLLCIIKTLYHWLQKPASM